MCGEREQEARARVCAGLGILVLLHPRQPHLGPSDSRVHQWAAPAYLVWSPAAWKEIPIVIAVEGDIQDVRVAVEGLLGPVPMVHILQEWGKLTQHRHTPPSGPGGSGDEETEGTGPRCVLAGLLLLRPPTSTKPHCALGGAAVSHVLMDCTALDARLMGTKVPAH